MACEHCVRPGPCDCWKAQLTPEARVAKQLEILAVFLAKLDEQAFAARQATRPRKTVWGQFGNRKQSAKRLKEKSA